MCQIVVIIMEKEQQAKGIEGKERLIHTGYSQKLVRCGH